MSNPSTQTVRDWLIGLQQRITAAIAAADGSGFVTDAWEKPPGEALQGNGITMILEDGPLFERAMEWLDSICYAAANTKEVQSACEAQPEWGLSCERYDGGDALLGLGGLTRHPEPLELLPQATMRYGLAEILQRILRADPLFEGAQLGLDPDAEVFCAEVVLERPRTVCVTLCAQVQPRDAVWHGVLEHSRLVRGDDPELSALLILPRLQVGRAMRLTPRVVLAGLAHHFDVGGNGLDGHHCKGSPSTSSAQRMSCCGTAWPAATKSSNCAALAFSGV